MNPFILSLIRILAFLWQKVVPVLLMVAFSIGVFYHLWDVQKIPMVWSFLITGVVGSIITYAFGKIIKTW